MNSVNDIRKILKEIGLKYKYDKDVGFFIGFQHEEKKMAFFIVLDKSSKRLVILSPELREIKDEDDLDKVREYVNKKNTFEVVFGMIGVFKSEKFHKIVYSHSVSLSKRSIEKSELEDYIDYLVQLHDEINEELDKHQIIGSSKNESEME